MSDMVETIRELCKSAGTSITRLEVELGWGNGTIGKWKKAKSAPPVDKLGKIADYFGVSVEYLLGTETKKEPTAEGGELSGKDMKFVEIVSSLGRDMQTILDAIATDPTYRPKREEKFVEVVCPLSGRVETIHQVYYVHDGKRVPYLNNGCDNRYACAECNQCQVRVMQSVR